MDKLTKACEDANSIYNGGACNPSGISRALVNACDAAREIVGTDAKQMEYAPARLILAQLNYLTGTGIGLVSEEDLVWCQNRLADFHAKQARKGAII